MKKILDDSKKLSLTPKNEPQEVESKPQKVEAKPQDMTHTNVTFEIFFAMVFSGTPRGPRLIMADLMPR